MTEKVNQKEIVLKSTFDAIWNACGLAKSLNYDEKGEQKN
jgi:hypothetical protein